MILETLPISHYVEKTRWCLEKSGLKFEEEKDIGIFGKLFLGRGVSAVLVLHENRLLLFVAFSACDGLHTGKKMPVLTA